MRYLLCFWGLVFLVTFIGFSVGIVVPFLFSYKSTFAVFGGWAYITGVMPVIVYLIYKWECKIGKPLVDKHFNK